MKVIQKQADISGREEVTETYVKKTGKFLFFKTEWYEKVSTTHVANDLLIYTVRPVRKIYVNDEEWIS